MTEGTDVTQTIDHTPAAAAPAPAKRPISRPIALLLLLGPLAVMGGLIAIISGGSHPKSEARACRMVAAGDPNAGGETLEQWYRKVLLSAPTGSNVEDAIASIYSAASHGRSASDTDMARLSMACTTVGVNIN